MKNTKSDQDCNYARYTFMTGTRTFIGVEMILSNMIDNFDEVTSHPDGSFSTTNNLIARNAISDIAIVMSYSLLEGFFHEEGEKNHIKHQGLIDLIDKLFDKHTVSLKDWENRRTLVDLLRVLRNAATHRNGIIKSDIDKEKFREIFGKDIFDKNYPSLSLPRSLWLLRELKSIADEYSEAVLKK